MKYLHLSVVCVCLADWGAAEEDAEDINVWEDNWDDDNIEDDFSEQLRWGGEGSAHCPTT